MPQMSRRSTLIQHRAQGREGELGVAAVSCGSPLVSQRPPAEALDVAKVPAEHICTTQGSLAVRERIYTTQGSLAGRKRTLTITGLMGCEGELVDAALSCGSQLVTQRPPARQTC
jgi:hypothetical protein